MKPHPFKGVWKPKIPIPEKPQLREDIIVATKEYLKTKKIEYQNDSPNGKITSVRVSEIGSYSDSPEFYYLEESLENNTIT